MNAWEMLAPETSAGKRARKIPAQRGSGAFVLCRDCNSFCGSEYVPEYTIFSRVVGQAIIDSAVNMPAGLSYPSRYKLDLGGWHLGSVARQALAMLLAVSGGGAVATLYPDLVDVILKKTSRVTDTRLGLSLTVGTNVRLAPPVCEITPSGISVFNEVAAAPFRWTLSWDGDGLRPPGGTADVTHWLRFTPEIVSESEQQIFTLGGIYSSAPGDMRASAEVQAQIDFFTERKVPGM